jgi:hypothetical protein
MPNDRDMQFLESLDYVDEFGYVWAVEKDFITDGKTTPRKLWWLLTVGSPYTGPARRGAGPHDKYSGIAGKNKAMRKLSDAMYKSAAKFSAMQNPELGFIQSHNSWAQHIGVRIGSTWKRWFSKSKIK